LHVSIISNRAQRPGNLIKNAVSANGGPPHVMHNVRIENFS